MRSLKIRLIALCGLMVLSAAVLAPIVVEAGCPQIIVECSDGSSHSCVGHQEGHRCWYDESCLGC